MDKETKRMKLAACLMTQLKMHSKKVYIACGRTDAIRDNRTGVACQVKI